MPALSASLAQATSHFLSPELLPELLRDINDVTLALPDYLRLIECKEAGAALLRSPFTKKLLPWIPHHINIHLLPFDLLWGAASKLTGHTKTLSFDTEDGRLKVTPEKFLEISECLRERLSTVTLPCEYIGFDEETPGKKRCRRAVTNSTLFGETLPEDFPATCTPTYSCSDVKAREVSFEKLVESNLKPPSAGIYISGFEYSAMGEAAVRREALAQCLSLHKSHASAQRLTTAMQGTVVEVLQAVTLGVELIHIAFPTKLAASGLALDLRLLPADKSLAESFGLPCSADEETSTDTFEMSATETEAQSAALDAIEKAPPVKVRCLVESQYEEDDGAFSFVPKVDVLLGRDADGFGSRYSKAYLCHLLRCHEPLSSQLLEWHNWRSLGLLMYLINRVKEQKGLKASHDYIRWLTVSSLLDEKALSVSERQASAAPLSYSLPTDFAPVEIGAPQAA